MIRRLLAIGVFALAAASCGGGDDAPANSSDGASGADDGTEILIEFEDGEAVRDVWRQDVPIGSTVSVVVAGERSEQVHVHGYDLYVEPDEDEAVLEFDALIPGRFEIELEQSGRLLLEITVS